MNNFILQLIFVLLSYGLYGKLNGKLDLSLPTFGFNFAILGFVILSALFCFFNRKKIYSVPFSLKTFTIFSIISIILFSNQENLLKSFCCVIAPIISYEIGAICANSDYGKDPGKYLISIYIGFGALFLICLYQLFLSPNILMLHRDFTFCVIFFVPYFTLLKSKTLKIIYSSALFFLIIVSVKRSLLLGLVLFYAIYYFIDIYINKGIRKTKKIIWTVSIICVLLIGFSYFSQSTYYAQLDDRLSKLSEDGGSGRDEIYENVFKGVAESDIIQLLFGHGYQSVEKEFGILSHNDLLEIGYDFGIISLICWIFTILYLLRRGIHFIKNGKFKRGALFLATLLFWQSIAETNCVIVTPEFSALIFLFFGLMNYQGSNYAKYNLPQSFCVTRAI